MKLTLLAFVPNLDPKTKDACGYETRVSSGGKQVKLPLEARFAYFADGFVSADRPRSAAHTEDITAAVKGWGLADESGTVIGKFKSAAAAEDARANAKVTLSVAVEPEKAEPEKAEAVASK